MSKKTMVAAAAALVAAAYGGGTWYSGAQAQKAFEEAAAELKHALGKDAVVTQSYDKGFFGSQSQLVVEWTPTEPSADAAEHDGDEAEPEPAPAVAAPVVAPKPMRLVVNSDIRHGPVAGGKLAAAVVDSRFVVEGVEDKVKQAFAKASMPTLTTVRHFFGATDWRFALPTGEYADDGVTARWAAMAYDVSLGSDKKTMTGDFKWPELVVTGLPQPAAAGEEDLDDEDSEGGTDPLGEQISIAIKGMGGSFNTTMLDGLWGVGPGKVKMQVASAQVTTQRADGQPEVVAELKDITGDTSMTADAKTLSINNQVKGVGRIGTMDFESLGYEEVIQRLDVEALRSLQQLVVDGYRAGGLAQALEPSEEKMAAWVEKSAPQLVQALPSYNMKLNARYQGNDGHVEYGIEVQKAPSAEEVAQKGWTPALLKGSNFNASARIPKAWVASLAKASGNEVEPEEMDAFVQMASGSGYVRVDGDFLTTSLKVQDGKMNLNGVVKPLPMGMGE